MNRSIFSYSIPQKIRNLILPDYVMAYLKALRKYEYYKHQSGIFNAIISAFSRMKMRKLGVKLGISLQPDVFGYGLVIPHYGTIVAGGGNKIGNYCVLHTATCITQGSKVIGDGLYLSTGAKILKDICLKDNVSVAANSVVNKSCEDSNCLLAGAPAKLIKASDAWYIRDGEEYSHKYCECEKLKKAMNIS